MTLRSKIYGGYIAALSICIIFLAYLLYHTERRDVLIESVAKIDFGKERHMDIVDETLIGIGRSAVKIHSISDQKALELESLKAQSSIRSIHAHLDSLAELIRISQFELNPSIMSAATRLLVSTAASLGITDPKDFYPIGYEEETAELENVRRQATRLSLSIGSESRLTPVNERKKNQKFQNESIALQIDSLRSALDRLQYISKNHTLTKTEMLGKLSVLNSILTYSIVAFLVLIILLQIKDARKILIGLEQITTATQEVGLGKFDEELKIKSFTELQGLGDSFNRMTRQLEEMDRLKSDFFNKLVHDFKSPLDNIKQSSAILAKDMTDAPLTPHQKKFMDIIQRSAGELRSMVQEQLEESRLIAGQSNLTYQLTDLKSLVKDRIQLQRPTAMNKNLNFSVKFTDADFNIICDASKISRVMDNLLSNAIRFSPKHSTISVELEDQEDKIQVRVKDSGSGIPQNLQPRIFQKYVRQITSDTNAGTGLGLYTAKYIVELHAGKIWFKSKPGFGTTFYFSLPKVKIASDQQTSNRI